MRCKEKSIIEEYVRLEPEQAQRQRHRARPLAARAILRRIDATWVVGVGHTTAADDTIHIRVGDK